MQKTEDKATATSTSTPEKEQPIFQEIETMTTEQAIEVLIQAANLAQNAGKLSVRDSVMLAKAISLARPGSI